jgi:hypothetical protein
MTATTRAPADDKIARLSRVSQKRLIDPDAEIPGGIGPGQVLPDELLSVADLDLDLSAEQRATLSREEVASITQAGINFEAVLEAGLAMQVVTTHDVTDPRVTYILHEIGEETRHQRLFVRMVEQLAPTAVNPLSGGVFRALERIGVHAIIKRPALLYTLILGGEEIPDLFQKHASEHPDTDPFIREVNRYHRQEEARHLSFARTVLGEVWEQASFTDRFAVRFIAPVVIRGMFDTIVHPGVYRTVGLPARETWKAANRSPRRVGLRHEATRPVLGALLDAGVLRAGHLPRGWQHLCGVDRHGVPA